MSDLSCRVLLAAATLVVVAPSSAIEPDLQVLLREFRDHSGAQLVFDRQDLPPGRYYDILKPLNDQRKANAAAICLTEARKYPRGYLGDVGLKAMGVFAACVSKTGDGFRRSYDQQLGGYRYFGVYNRSDAVAAAYYSDGQLQLTFHHEIFHHIDSTAAGKTESWLLSSDDAVFQAAISGKKPYAAPQITAEDLAALRSRRIGIPLPGPVSEYAAKNSSEDQAETARHLMSTLPDALVQIVEQPRLAGSQRILHVLGEYEQSVPDGPGINWFVDVALQRVPHTLDQILDRLQTYARQGHTGYEGVINDSRGARATLDALARFDSSEVPAEKAAGLVRLATEVTQALLKARIQPDRKQQRFVVWGGEDADGVNWTLRADVKQFAADADRLRRIAELDQQQSELLTRTQMKNLRLIARYYTYIGSQWSVTAGTRQTFEAARQTLCGSLPLAHASLSKSLREAKLRELSWRISADGQAKLQN